MLLCCIGMIGGAIWPRDVRSPSTVQQTLAPTWWSRKHAVRVHGCECFAVVIFETTSLLFHSQKGQSWIGPSVILCQFAETGKPQLKKPVPNRPPHRVRLFNCEALRALQRAIRVVWKAMAEEGGMGMSAIGSSPEDMPIASQHCFWRSALVTSPYTSVVPLARWRLLQAPAPHSSQSNRPLCP